MLENCIISNDGYRIIVGGSFGSLNLDNIEYEAKEIYLHSPSEHLVHPIFIKNSSDQKSSELILNSKFIINL